MSRFGETLPFYAAQAAALELCDLLEAADRACHGLPPNPRVLPLLAFAARITVGRIATLLVQADADANPDDWTWRGGRLFNAPAHEIEDDAIALADHAIDTHEETDVFHALGLPAWEPHIRCGSLLRQFLFQRDNSNAHGHAQGRRGDPDRGYAPFHSGPGWQGEAAH